MIMKDQNKEEGQRIEEPVCQDIETTAGARGGKDMMTRGQKVNKESEQQERANKHNLHLGLLVK